MNERIKELAEQAGFVDKGNNITAYLNFDHEKFAELVVQECIGIVENLPAGYKDYRDQIEDAFRRDCVVELKDHFGVNE